MAGSGHDTPRRVAASSDHLPADADERAHRQYWEEIATYAAGAVEIGFVTPCSWRFDAVRFGPVLVERFKGAIVRGTRTSRHIAADGRDHFFIGMNCGGPASIRGQASREVVKPPGSTTLLSLAEPAEIRKDGSSVWLSAYIPRTRLTERVRNAEGLMGSTLDPDTPAARHLRRYLRLVLSPGSVPPGDSHLDEHVATTLIDLTAAALCAQRDEAERAGLRGLHAARLALATAEIWCGFTDPGFSVHTVAAKLFVAPRTLQDLLHEAGPSFTERVLELRLQKARQMLASPEQRDTQVAKIAYACGFSDISYFNRCFRRRFGASPRELRM